MAMRRPGRVEVEIRELVLRGLPPAERHRIGEALREELASLLSRSWAEGAGPASREAPRLDGGRIRLTPGAGPERTGRRIARAVHGALEP
jgi:hypothetical protein